VGLIAINAENIFFDCECNLMSRPQIPINWDIVDEMLAAGSPGTEVASAIGMHEDTLYLRIKDNFSMTFTAYKAQKQASGEALLRLTQYKKAIGLSKKGDNTLLIWLGKQRLNQKENVDHSIVGEAVTKHYEEMLAQLKSLQEQKPTSVEVE